MTRLKLFLIILIVILLYVIAALLLPLPSKGDEKNPQVVLEVVSNGTEEKLVVAKAVVILRIAPTSGPTAKTPLSRGDKMICRPANFEDEINHVFHTGFKCGEDTYILMGIRYQGGK